ncbi:hypothetical protein KEM48_013351 [Puccinia striiformis f. sp. tritici PST-130]|nr:hypothetical protein KEM48_013351 [Puccinia striiformis f. sp. tritici PST-130]
MQRTPTRTRSQGPVDFPLDQDIDKLGKLNNPRKKTPLEDVPQSTPNRQDPIDPLHVPSSRSSSRSSLPAKTERGRSRRRRNPDLTQNGDSDSEEDPPYEQAPEDPQGLISTLIKALNARPTSDHTTSKFKTPGMKAPDRFDGESPSKLRPFFELVESYSQTILALLPMTDKGFYSKKPDCILNNWDKFEQQLFTLFGDPNEVRNAEYELNNLQMKESSKAWNDAAFTFHFRKGLPPRITDQLAISGLRLTSLQQLIDRTIELDNCYHDKNRSKNQKTPRSKMILQNLMVINLQENRNNSLPHLQVLQPRHFRNQKPGQLPKRYLRFLVTKDSSRTTNVLGGKKKAYSISDHPRVNLRTCETEAVPSSRFILFDSSNHPYRVLLDSGANVSFISLTFAKLQSLELIECKKFPIFLVSSSSEPSYWVSRKAKWIFKFSTFPSFEWELVVLDAPGMDDTILGHDFLVHWNPDVNWKEGVINLRTNTHQSTNLSSVKLN